MAFISNLTLQIIEGPPTLPVGKARVTVSYKISATNHDVEHVQDYHEVVRLIGDDRGEGGTAQPLQMDPIHNGVVTFTTSYFNRSWEKIINSSILDEDPVPVIREDEIRAVVTLTPIPPISVTKESNLIKRGGPIVSGG